MIEVIPAVIPPDLKIIRERFTRVLGLARRVQVDVIDGHYAPSVTWPFGHNQMDELLRMVRGEERFPFVNDFEIEIDMMVLHPVEYISDFLSIGAKSFVIHLDSTDHAQICLETVKNAGCEAGIGIKPSGKIEDLQKFLPIVDFVQFMGNDRIGFNGVELDQKVLPMINRFHELHPSVPIQIDIGVSLETAPKLIDAGVTRLVSTSAIFSQGDPKENIARLADL